jgi:hypothetical protein
MHPKSFFDSANVAVQNGKCFVLMPFSDEFDEVYETIREAVESPELNFTCERADDLRGAGHIMESVLKGIGESEIVIADLTNRNPNVFYELGIAHMVKRIDKVVLLIQDIELMPFDLTPFRCITYKQTIAGARKLKTDIILAIKEVADLLTITREGTPRTHQFRLEQREKYKLPIQLFGEENCLYDFEVSADYLGDDGVKFTLTLTQYIAGRPPKRLSPEYFGMSQGMQRKVPRIPWNIRLDTLSRNGAVFQLIQE